MKSKLTIIILILVNSLYSNILNAQNKSEEENKPGIYLGINYGFNFAEIGYVKLPLKLGGVLLYNTNNNFYSLSYNRLFTLNIFDVPKYDRCKLQRIELSYGKTIALTNTHPVFKYFHITGTAGLSFHVIDFFQNQNDYYNNKLSSANKLGIPLSLSLSSGFSSAFGSILEYKYHIISGYAPYGEIGGSILVHIF